MLKQQSIIILPLCLLCEIGSKCSPTYIAQGKQSHVVAQRTLQRKRLLKGRGCSGEVNGMCGINDHRHIIGRRRIAVVQVSRKTTALSLHGQKVQISTSDFWDIVKGKCSIRGNLSRIDNFAEVIRSHFTKLSGVH